MDLIVNALDWQAICVSAALVAAVAASWLIRLALSRERRRVATLSARVTALEGDLHVLCASASSAGDRVISLERRSRELVARQEQLDTTGGSTPHFRHAVALLDRGASTEELVQTCGMVRGEAELVAYLHHQNSAEISSKIQ